MGSDATARKRSRGAAQGATTTHGTARAGPDGPGKPTARAAKPFKGVDEGGQGERMRRSDDAATAHRRDCRPALSRRAPSPYTARLARPVQPFQCR